MYNVITSFHVFISVFPPSIVTFSALCLQSSLSAAYSELTELSSNRHHRLLECKQLHHFHRECDEVEVWIVGREAVAASEELGKDLEHVEVYSTHM